MIASVTTSGASNHGVVGFALGKGDDLPGPSSEMFKVLEALFHAVDG